MKKILSLVLVMAGMAEYAKARAVSTKSSASDAITQKSTMTPEAMKTAYVYLTWYANNLDGGKLKQEQKDQLEKSRKEVEAAVSSEGKEVDTHQLWQKLGELEKTLGVIASALNMPHPPSVFSGIIPASSTQLSVRPSKQLREKKAEGDALPEVKEPVLVMSPTIAAPEADPDED